MSLVEVKVAQAKPETCPLNRQNCVECRYNISLSVLNLSKAVYVVCGYEEEGENGG